MENTLHKSLKSKIFRSQKRLPYSFFLYFINTAHLIFIVHACANRKLSTTDAGPTDAKRKNTETKEKQQIMHIGLNAELNRFNMKNYSCIGP